MGVLSTWARVRTNSRGGLVVCERVGATQDTGQKRAHRLRRHSTMKRNQSSRPSSPTPTTFSGISNYRTESYRPVKDQGSMPAMPFDPKVVARTHYNELQQYLVSYLAKCPYDSLMFMISRNLTPILQHRRILARLRDRNSPGSPSSNSRSFPLMYMTSSYAGR